MPELTLDEPELYDRTGRGTPDFKDFIATALGACVVLPLVLM